jgi:hypothetical protein
MIITFINIINIIIIIIILIIIFIQGIYNYIPETSNDNSGQKEIQRWILAGNRTYFSAICLFRNRLLFRATKIRLYKTLIRPVATYVAETWTMTKKEEQAMLIFERKIFRRIYGPKYEDGENWDESRTRRDE